MRAAFSDGIRAVAIALMHGYRYPDHERALAALANEIGFTQVSASHDVSPLIKIVGRGDTTVVNAYLSPILRRYVAQVSEELDVERTGIRLMFMMSSGGLTAARMFQGRDAILPTDYPLEPMDQRRGCAVLSFRGETATRSAAAWKAGSGVSQLRPASSERRTVTPRPPERVAAADAQVTQTPSSPLEVRFRIVALAGHG